MEATDKVLNRIKKMLALANDAAATEGERDNAMRMAYATMAKHNIDMATVESSGQQQTEKREEHYQEFFGRPWARQVAHAIARMLFCEYVVSHVGGEKSKIYKHRFIGRTSNAVTAAELSRYLVNSIIKEARTRYGSGGSAEGRTFSVGATSAIRERVRKMIQEATQPPVEKTPGTALVLVNMYRSEAEANAMVLRSMYPKLQAARGGKGVHDSDAYRAGQQYGSTVSLNRQIK